MIRALVILILTISSAAGQPVASSSMEQRFKQQLGELMFSNTVLAARLEDTEAKVAQRDLMILELRKQLEDAKKAVSEK